MYVCVGVGSPTTIDLAVYFHKLLVMVVRRAKPTYMSGFDRVLLFLPFTHNVLTSLFVCALFAVSLMAETKSVMHVCEAIHVCVNTSIGLHVTHM